MDVSTIIAIRPLQDFQAKVEGGRLYDMGGSTVNYGIYVCSVLQLHTQLAYRLVTSGCLVTRLTEEVLWRSSQIHSSG